MTPRQMSPTMMAAAREAARRSGSATVSVKADHELICKMANAMRDERQRLIAEPMSRCWERLAMAALKAIDHDREGH